MTELDEKTIATKIGNADHKDETVGVMAIKYKIDESEVRKIAVKYGTLLPWTDDAVKHAYDSGFTDSQLVDAFGYREEIVKQWREKNRLAPNKVRPNVTSSPQRGRESHLDYAKASELYKEGRSDGSIANILGTSSNTIWNWRKRNNLPANRQNKDAKTAKYVSKQPSVSPKISQCHCCGTEIPEFAPGISVTTAIKIGGEEYKLCPKCAIAFEWVIEKLGVKK